MKVKLNLKRTGLTRHVAAALALGYASAARAEVIPDVSTPTSVVTGARGQAVVNVAPPVAGVSHNAYVEFNVGKAGVEFANEAGKARLIVNEVVSARPSLVEGALSVVGPRANLIIANPNGITVNGGSFVNTGNVALSTGRVQFKDFDIAPGVPQRNVVLTTNQGAIEIGAGGLSGAFNSLELIAKQLRVNGPVLNTVSRADARIRAVVGSSLAEIDAAVSPTDNLTPWIAYDNTGAASEGAVLVDITELGSMSAGKIQIAVTDQGAGVRHAGQLYAHVGDFTLSASGDLTLIGGTVRAAQNVNVQAGAVALHASVSQQQVHSARLTSDAGTIVIEADRAIELRGGEIAARGDIALSAAAFVQRNAGDSKSATVAAAGGVLIAASGDVQNIGSLIQGNTPFANGAAVVITSGGSIVNSSADAVAQPAVIYAGAGSVNLEAADAIHNHSARVLASEDVVMRAGGAVVNEVGRAGAVADGELQRFNRKTRDWLGLAKRDSGFSVDYGELAGSHTEAFIKAGGDVIINAHDVANRGGNIYADAGDIRLTANQSIDNAGLAIGQARFKRHCNVLFCRASASSNVSVSGGEISAARDVVLTAGEAIENVGGRVLALNDLTLSAPRVAARGITGYSSIDRDKGMKAWFGDTWARVYAADVGGSFTANGGKLTINGTVYTDGATLSGANGVEASGGVIEMRPVQRQPVEIGGNRIGLTSWFD